ncbi:type II secretion system F family protein [Pseudalkalibacillus caeni]|uniref:Type II secretion system F family protein n=1 Tax=Exobacillus caeni TaxID=2574798 RepID=A0A5R9EZN6_9BACL|nr:type II secretion system F family protein [Pseudalkalibacillus caeni]TLS35580.1 type II secretion system F family protein [Pseudalkalibacillus caeni]
MGVLFFICTSVCLTMVLYGLLAGLFKKRIQLEKRIQSLATHQEGLTKNNHDERKPLTFKERVLQPVWAKLRTFFIAKLSRQKMEELDNRIYEAGNPFNLKALDFKLLQIVIAIGFFSFLMFFYVFGAEEKGKVMLFAIMGGVFGYIYPDYYLRAKRKQRLKTIEKAMPDYFDMVSVSIEAGMGIDAALSRVSKEMKGPLSDEFKNAIEEMKLGKSRREAFIDLKDRVPLEIFQSVLNSFIQADQLGIGMSKVLKTQTKRIREVRRQAAREQAMKAPVKMMIPMVLFIFPTLFIVLLGPIIIQFVTRWM